MNLGQLEVLIAIVDTGSLTEAGEAVGLTQSAVSYSLSKLETELGVTLLDRGRNGITVTRIGEEVVQHARVILTQTEVIRQKAARERGIALGKIRLGFVSSVPPQLLTGILRNFQYQYPEVEVILFEGTPIEQMNWLDSGVIDIGTVIKQEMYPVSIPLVQDEIKIIVSIEHPFATKTSIDITDLSDQLFVGPKSEYSALRDLLDTHHWSPPRLQFEVSSPTTIFAMVRENMGISFLPNLLIDTSIPQITTLSINPPMHINVWLGANTTSPAIHAFLESANEWAHENGYLSD